ncbi:kinetochore Sim4 complex subunit Fta4 [Amylocarpus encephaloides]|uniref:Kinetochore Sim4 complex subunit Fta4 n=1 Tax=Amylocarpus encephaloides TaxID=45428 RepID=A0A9P7YKN6_9HELO|nr:kinetochore Sim4 complex subunit Fta4 [Amylocarpus encephaloides]
MADTTITHLKTVFLRSQITTLSTPFRPSSTFLDAQTHADDALRPRHLDEALTKLNTRLKHHNKTAYGSQAVRHVAGQIDRLYWNAGDRGAARGVGAGGEEWVVRGGDLSRAELIDQLPESWSEEATVGAPEQSAQFAESQRKLRELNERRKAAKEKVEAYTAWRGLLEPFADVGEDVQPNVVRKDGEVERELEKMKLLLLRVERAVGGLERKEGEGEDGMDWEGEEEGRVLGILGGG